MGFYGNDADMNERLAHASESFAAWNREHKLNCYIPTFTRNLLGISSRNAYPDLDLKAAHIR
eukprot:12467519-Alexandrium_andersonii.AAC.1